MLRHIIKTNGFYSAEIILNIACSMSLKWRFLKIHMQSLEYKLMVKFTDKLFQSKITDRILEDSKWSSTPLYAWNIQSKSFCFTVNVSSFSTFEHSFSVMFKETFSWQSSERLEVWTRGDHVRSPRCQQTFPSRPDCWHAAPDSIGCLVHFCRRTKLIGRIANCQVNRFCQVLVENSLLQGSQGPAKGWYLLYTTTTCQVTQDVFIFTSLWYACIQPVRDQ